MPDSYNITHSPPRAVAGKYPDDHWNRLLRNVYIGIVKHFTEAGVDDPVIDEPHLTLDKVHEVCTRLEHYPVSLITITAATELSEAMHVRLTLIGTQRLTCGALQGGTFLHRIHHLGPAEPGMMYPNDPLRDYLARVYIDSDWLYVNKARTNIRKVRKDNLAAGSVGRAPLRVCS